MSKLEIEGCTTADAAQTGHNGGPPLDEHVPEWGSGGIGNYFYWKAAHRGAWKLKKHARAEPLEACQPQRRGE